MIPENPYFEGFYRDCGRKDLGQTPHPLGSNPPPSRVKPPNPGLQSEDPAYGILQAFQVLKRQRTLSLQDATNINCQKLITDGF